MTETRGPAERWLVRPPRDEDYGRWRELYAGYAAFYGVEQPDENADRVWGWIRDEHHEVECLLVEGPSRGVVGLAHVRRFARPLHASVGGYLDDLFVAPEARGTGAVDALLAALSDLARRRGWTVIRWITAADNHRARAKYDRVAERTGWVTYDLRPDG